MLKVKAVHKHCSHRGHSHLPSVNVTNIQLLTVYLLIIFKLYILFPLAFLSWVITKHCRRQNLRSRLRKAKCKGRESSSPSPFRTTPVGRFLGSYIYCTLNFSFFISLDLYCNFLYLNFVNFSDVNFSSLFKNSLKFHPQNPLPSKSSSRLRVGIHKTS